MTTPSCSSTDFGKGTLNTSGYPRIVKLWHRGQKIADAKTVYEGKMDDVWAQPQVLHGPYGTVPLVVRGITFFTGEYLVCEGRRLDREAAACRDSADFKGITQGQIVALLRHDWTPEGGKPIAQGSLIAFPLKPFLDTGKMPKVSVLFTPDAHGAIADVAPGRDAVFASIFENVTGSIHAFQFANGAWQDKVLDMPKNGSTAVVSVERLGAGGLFHLSKASSPRPRSMPMTAKSAPRAIKSVPARFDAATETLEQHWATSKDGTKVPYFVMKPKGAKGPLPTILYSYGGFELSLFPWYWNDGHRPLHAGKEWVGRGGAIVVANIRGGAEFGPKWHQGSMKFNHKHAFEDFAAVGRDVIARGLTTRKADGHRRRLQWRAAGHRHHGGEPR